MTLRLIANTIKWEIRGWALGCSTLIIFSEPQRNFFTEKSIIMNERLVFILLLCVIVVLWRTIDYWRKRTGETAFAAAQITKDTEERDRFCRLAVRAGHRDACRMFCCSHPNLFEEHTPLKMFRSHGIKMVFYGYYYPSRYKEFLNKEQLAFCHSVYEFKEGKIHGIEFFKSCMNALQMNAYPFHIMFMPCSDEFKYTRRFKRLNWYIHTHCPYLTSGLYDVDVFEPRECLHEAIGHENRILERNYRITGDIKGKEVIIVDDVLTTGQSLTDYKGEIERCGGKVVAAIFYGETITMPHPLTVKLEVWGDYLTRFSKSN